MNRTETDSLLKQVEIKIPLRNRGIILLVPVTFKLDVLVALTFVVKM